MARPSPTTYGSNTAPIDLGSGGGVYQGTGQPGGGAIKLTVTGTFLNNGIISANATPVNNFVGGSAGGSIFVTANALTGNGYFAATGATNPSSNANGGGGGRIAIYAASFSGFTGFSDDHNQRRRNRSQQRAHRRHRRYVRLLRHLGHQL